MIDPATGRPDSDAFRPRSWFRLRSIHWVVAQYGCIVAYVLLGGVHGSGPGFLAAMFVIALAGSIHAMIELSAPELRGAVHPVITLVLLGVPFCLPWVVLFDM